MFQFPKPGVVVIFMGIPLEDFTLGVLSARVGSPLEIFVLLVRIGLRFHAPPFIILRSTVNDLICSSVLHYLTSVLLLHFFGSGKTNCLIGWMIHSLWQSPANCSSWSRPIPHSAHHGALGSFDFCLDSCRRKPVLFLSHRIQGSRFPSSCSAFCGGFWVMHERCSMKCLWGERVVVRSYAHFLDPVHY
jgi:hypothetical protein